MPMSVANRRLKRERQARKIKLAADDMWRLADELRRRKISVEASIAILAEAVALLLEAKTHGR